MNIARSSITERIDAVTDVTRDYWQTVVPAPRSIKVSLDDACQFRCGFCARGSGSGQSAGPMEWGMYCRLVDEMVREGIEEIGLFFIGEPMMAARLLDAVRYAKEAGIGYVFLTTNGALATGVKVKALMEAGLDSIKFSFNYADGAQVKEVAGVSERNFGRIVANIKDARAVKDAGGFGCGIYASSIMLDGEQGVRMKEAVKEIEPYVDEHYWLPLFSFGGQTDFGAPVRGNPGRLDRMREPLPCWSVFKEGHITSAGDISLCCFDSHHRWVVGNLAGGTFMEAWNCQEAQDLRAAHLRKDVTGTACEHCAVGA
jgi:hypothetical protein